MNRAGVMKAGMGPLLGALSRGGIVTLMPEQPRRAEESVSDDDALSEWDKSYIQPERWLTNEMTLW